MLFLHTNQIVVCHPDLETLWEIAVLIYKVRNIFYLLMILIYYSSHLWAEIASKTH